MSTDPLTRLSRQVTQLAVFLHTELTSLPKSDSGDLSQIMRLEPADALVMVKTRLAELVKFKRDVMMTREYDDFKTMQQYQGALQKLESEVRNHIKVEQQLKLHIENLHSRMEDAERGCEKHKKESRQLSEKLKEVLEDTQSTARDSSRKEDQSKFLQEIMQLRHFAKRDQTRISELEKVMGKLEAESILQKSELLDKSKECEKLLREVEKYKAIVSHMKENIQFVGELRDKKPEDRPVSPLSATSQKKLNTTQRSNSTERLKRPLTATRKVNLLRSIAKALPTSSGLRVKLTLPSAQDCWFFFTNTDNFEKVQTAIQAEDPLVTSVASEYTPDVSLATVLATHGKATIRINDEEVTISRLESEKCERKVNFFSRFTDTIESKKPHTQEELDQVAAAVIHSLGEEALAKIEKISAQLTELQTHIDVLETARGRLERKLDRRVTFFGLLGVAYMTAQWGGFYYTIYGVEWLGWDLMEPITYSVGQLGFLFAVWYFMRTRNPNSFSALSSRFRSKRVPKLAKYYSLDLELLAKLQGQKAELLSQRSKLIKRLVKGGPLPD